MPTSTDSDQQDEKPRLGSKARLRAFLEANLGVVVNSEQLQAASGNASEWGRRLRELRDDEGYAILSLHDDPRLKPGEYRLDTLERTPGTKRTIDKKLRARVLEAAAGVCQRCGAVVGEPHPDYPKRIVRLHVSHVTDKAKGGKETFDNLVALCSICNEGAAVDTKAPPSQIELSTAIRRAPRDVQRAAYEQLRKMFENKR